MSRLTILIPARSVAECDDLLVSVLQNRPRGTDIVVAHSAPYDDPYDLAAEVRFVKVAGKTSHTGLLNAGLQTIRGEFVHVLAPHMRVVEGWTEAPLAWFDQPEIAAVSPLCTSVDDDQQMIAGVGYQVGGKRKVIAGSHAECLTRCAKEVLGPTLSAGFYRRRALVELGGFSESVGDQLADIDLALSLHEAGWQAVVDPRSRVIVVQPQSAVESAWSEGWHTERLFWRHVRLQGWPLSLVCHPWVAMAAVLSDLPRGGAFLQLAGRLLACLELGTSARHTQAVQIARTAKRQVEPAPTLLPFPVGKRLPQQAERRAA